MTASNRKTKYAIHGPDAVERLREDTEGAKKVAEFLRSLTGINLVMTDKNRTLIAARLARTMETLDLHSFEDYLDYLSSGDDSALVHFISQLTTNTTHFFRESSHFKQLTNCLMERMNRRNRDCQPLEIWCSACSQGQEAYSIAMTADATLGENANFKVLASDIDHEVLAKAALGVYTEHEAESVPEPFHSRYLVPSSDRRFVRVNSGIRNKVEFAEFNLSSDSFPFPKRFDIVFCRNVLIYFDRSAAMKVVENLTECLVPGGYLFLGHSESSVGKAHGLKALAPAFYQKG